MPFCSLGATQENTEHCWIQQKQENMLLATNFVLAHCILPKIEQKISVHTNFLPTNKFNKMDKLETGCLGIMRLVNKHDFE